MATATDSHNCDEASLSCCGALAVQWRVGRARGGMAARAMAGVSCAPRAHAAAAGDASWREEGGGVCARSVRVEVALPDGMHATPPRQRMLCCNGRRFAQCLTTTNADCLGCSKESIREIPTTRRSKQDALHKA